ncbi:MAG: hypothetical protein O9353_03405, partial [Bacteroidia bacterium]|nr:hypothetical protein [Bacteroidia bacterium]
MATVVRSRTGFEYELMSLCPAKLMHKNKKDGKELKEVFFHHDGFKGSPLINTFRLQLTFADAIPNRRE